MLKDLVISIQKEMLHRRQTTTRRYSMADGTEYIVTLANWRWQVLDQCRPDDQSMKSLLDLVLLNTSIWARCRPGLPKDQLFNECLEDRVDFDAVCLRPGRLAPANQDYRMPWHARVAPLEDTPDKLTDRDSK